jgi:hypothetical protein
MAVRRSQKLVVALGMLSLLIGIVSGILYVDSALKHGNVGSDPYWVDPPTTNFDRFILHFPVAWFLIFGFSLLVIALISALLAWASRTGASR